MRNWWGFIVVFIAVMALCIAIYVIGSFSLYLQQGR
jgi:hypothetical protein